MSHSDIIVRYTGEADRRRMSGRGNAVQQFPQFVQVRPIRCHHHLDQRICQQYLK